MIEPVIRTTVTMEKNEPKGRTRRTTTSKDGRENMKRVATRKSSREEESRNSSFFSYEEALDHNDEGTNTSGTWRHRTSLDPPPVAVDTETRNVYCAKLVMIGVLSIATIAVAMTTFLVMSGQVEAKFKQRVSNQKNYN